MIKNVFVRAINSFMYSVGITVIFQMVFQLLAGESTNVLPVVPEFAARFSDEVTAVLVQTLLIGLCSAVIGGGSVIMELEKIGLLVQSVLYFVLTAAVWVPVACFCWSIHKYLPALLSVSVSYIVAYVISWTVEYRQCKKSVAEINERLSVLRESTTGF